MNKDKDAQRQRQAEGGVFNDPLMDSCYGQVTKCPPLPHPCGPSLVTSQGELKAIVWQSKRSFGSLKLLGDVVERILVESLAHFLCSAPTFHAAVCYLGVFPHVVDTVNIPSAVFQQLEAECAGGLFRSCQAK